MNQGKLEMVKQEMTRVKIDILGISELKQTRIGEFNSDDHFIYHCGQEFFRRNGVALIVNKSPKCSTWVQSQKWQNDLCSFPRKAIQYHSNPSLCPNHWHRRSWIWTVLWWPTRPSRTKTKKRWCWGGKPGMLQSMGSQRHRHDWTTELKHKESHKLGF